MSTIRNVGAADRPPPYSNHVIVEPVAGGYQASGVSNLNQHITYLSTQVYRDVDRALHEAMAWAIDHGIPEVFVIK